MNLNKVGPATLACYALDRMKANTDERLRLIVEDERRRDGVECFVDDRVLL